MWSFYSRALEWGCLVCWIMRANRQLFPSSARAYTFSLSVECECVAFFLSFQKGHSYSCQRCHLISIIFDPGNLPEIWCLLLPWHFRDWHRICGHQEGVQEARRQARPLLHELSRCFQVQVDHGGGHLTNNLLWPIKTFPGCSSFRHG